MNPVLLLNAPVSDELLNDLTVEASDSTFGDGSNLHGGKYFGNKKELKKNLTEIAIKGNIEFQTRKSNSSLWVIKCIDPNCNWRLLASKITIDSVYFVIRKYMGIHSCSLLNIKANHRQATYIVVGEQVC